MTAVLLFRDGNARAPSIGKEIEYRMINLDTLRPGTLEFLRVPYTVNGLRKICLTKFVLYSEQVLRNTR